MERALRNCYGHANEFCTPASTPLLPPAAWHCQEHASNLPIRHQSILFLLWFLWSSPNARLRTNSKVFRAHISQTVTYPTIRVYLSAIRLVHIENQLSDPLSDTPLLLDHYLCQAVRRSQPSGHPSRLPILPRHLKAIKSQLSKFSLLSHDKLAYWAAFTYAFFGFCRVSEFTSPAPATHPPLLTFTCPLGTLRSPFTTLRLISLAALRLCLFQLLTPLSARSGLCPSTPLSGSLLAQALSSSCQRASSLPVRTSSMSPDSCYLALLSMPLRTTPIAFESGPPQRQLQLAFLTTSLSTLAAGQAMRTNGTSALNSHLPRQPLARCAVPPSRTWHSASCSSGIPPAWCHYFYFLGRNQTVFSIAIFG